MSLHSKAVGACVYSLYCLHCDVEGSFICTRFLCIKSAIGNTILIYVFNGRQQIPVQMKMTMCLLTVPLLPNLQHPPLRRFLVMKSFPPSLTYFQTKVVCDFCKNVKNLLNCILMWTQMFLVQNVVTIMSKCSEKVLQCNKVSKSWWCRIVSVWFINLYTNNVYVSM